MKKFNVVERNTVKRIPKRGVYEQTEINDILDAGFICHVGFQIKEQVFVIPTAYGRKDNSLLLHGSSKSRMMEHISQGGEVCICVTHLDGIVLARSLFHYSMNYRSAVIFGEGILLQGDDKMEALKCISDQIVKDRWKEARLPTAKEMKATSVVQIKIDSASAKIRTGGPVDEQADYDLPIWAGEIPICLSYGEPIQDMKGLTDINVPVSVSCL